jgi:hypothetical protein
MPAITKAGARILRIEPQDFFEPEPFNLVAVLDQVKNIVHLNELYKEDRLLFSLALFMEGSLLRLPRGYLPR